MRKQKNMMQQSKATNFPFFGIIVLIAMGIATIVYVLYDKYKEMK